MFKLKQNNTTVRTELVAARVQTLQTSLQKRCSILRGNTPKLR